MAGKVDWKQKYDGLRAKYLNAIDVAFRLGVEEGARNAEMEQMQQQIAEMQEAEAMAAEAEMMGGEPEVDENGMPIEGEEEMLPEEEMMPEEEGGDELGGAMDELEEYVKNEGSDKLINIMKSFHKGKSEVKETKSEKEEKVGKLVKKWDEENEEDTDDGDLGQA